MSLLVAAMKLSSEYVFDIIRSSPGASFMKFRDYFSSKYYHEADLDAQGKALRGCGQRRSAVFRKLEFAKKKR